MILVKLDLVLMRVGKQLVVAAEILGSKAHEPLRASFSKPVVALFLISFRYFGGVLEHRNPPPEAQFIP